MREVVLIGTVAVLCILGLFRPRIGLLGYIWFALMRPDALSWSVGHPYSLCLAVCTVLGSLFHLPKFLRLFTNPISLGLVLLIILFTVSTAFAVDPALSWPAWDYFIRMVFMTLLIVVFTEQEQHLRVLLLLVACSVGFLGLKLGVYGFAVGQADYMDDLQDTLLSDNNMLALALAMVAPLCWYGRQITESSSLRTGLLALLFGCIAGVVMTNSRGGALSLAGGLLVVAMRANRRMAAVAVVALCAAPAVYIVHDTYIARLSTITANQDKADGSIRSRIAHQHAAVAMWNDYPLLGVGFGMLNYAHIAPRYLGYEDNHVTHNTYLQVLADDGMFAFVVYSALLFGSIVWLERSGRSIRKTLPGKEVYPFAVQATLIAFAIGSFFLSRDSYDLLYIMLMAAAAWRTVEKQLPAHEQRNMTGMEGPFMAA